MLLTAAVSWAGLSYSTFKYAWAAPAAATAAPVFVPAAVLEAELGLHRNQPHLASGVHTTSVVVTNTGTVAADDVVLFFVKPPAPGSAGAPLKSLAGFERVLLAPGESRTLNFNLTVFDLSLVVPKGSGGVDVAEREVVRGEWQLEVGVSRDDDHGASGAAQQLHVLGGRSLVVQ